MQSGVGGGPGRMADDDLLVLVLGGCAAVLVVAGSLGLFWRRVVGWLVDHQVLVAHAAQPLLQVPYAGGAGLDGPRVVIAAGLLVLILGVTAAWVRRTWLQSRQVCAL